MRERLPGAEHRLLRGYGPLAGFVVLVLVAVLLAPTVAREHIVVSERGGTTGVTGTEGREGRTGTVNVAASGSQGTASSGTGKVSACEGRDKQVPGDGYSPPCIAFSGSNGGETPRGVTKDSVRVSLRVTRDPDFSPTLAELAGADITE